MKERPILFSAPMVLALLAGRKSQTRRLVKPPPWADRNYQPGAPMWTHDKLSGFFAEHVFGHCLASIAGCPHGAVGDRLWVREAWLQWACPRHDEGQAPGTRCDCDDPKSIRYQADHPEGTDREIHSVRWRPSIHMPRWVSRITLELTEVRVERLQDISEEDARAEGCPGHDVEPIAEGGTIYSMKGRSSAPSPLAHFRILWESLHGPDSWALNPWLWVLSFRRVE